MKKLISALIVSAILLVGISQTTNAASLRAAATGNGTGFNTTNRVIKVDMVVMQQTIKNNRLGAEITDGQMYVLRRDVLPVSAGYDQYGNDLNQAYSGKLEPGKVKLRQYKRPRPMVIRANVGDILEITLTNLLPKIYSKETNSINWDLMEAGVQVMGLDWLSKDNAKRIKPGVSYTYRFEATGEGVYMMYSPNGHSIPDSQLDYGLFGAVNVQPAHAEYYRSQVTAQDLQLATYRVNETFMQNWWSSDDPKVCDAFLDSAETGLPANVSIRRLRVDGASGLACPQASPDALWEMRIPTLESDKTAMVSSVLITKEGFLNTAKSQPVIDYNAMYPASHARVGSPVLNMLAHDPATDSYELAHSDLTAIITGPQAGRFPYYVDSPNFIENPATPDRRQPYREFTIAYHISPNTKQAFKEFDSGPLANMLAAGKDAFAVNYGIAGIAPEIFANRINLGPQGINQDGVDLLFEEFFLSAWAVGDPAVLVDNPANTGRRATKALYPDDPSNVYHSYMRDHVKFRVMNAGSVAPHVHHQHAHQWLHTPNSSDSHYLDSQMISPGSTYTLEMTYNGSGNRNQTVGDSIFHCHIYPHFAQGMWSMWRVHDVFEAGTKLDVNFRPQVNSRALPDGEIVAGTPIPALVPLPSLAMAPTPAKAYLVDSGRRIKVEQQGSDENGEPVFRNPGFPFFIPGVAGHRAPHPPLDFAWKENPDRTPKILSASEAAQIPHREEGEIAYLDGGLPRSIVLDGTLDREFHTRWDFTKDVDEMKAMQLPETGTAVEKAAMRAHATRTHPSHLPNGLPGNFILNGLPPAPGAPFAAPEVNDDGNSTFNKRRYKAAVIQTDVVFNKQGWHYPQQRFITLLDDVKATVAGERPPEPFFFRAETGETVEFWHTNLVPNYYELDDFQVRTPTDILGQHIHLVKFDVTASDGAGNGFNYEDGTFSPVEVQDRIKSINKTGGLHLFDPSTQFLSSVQVPLKLSNYKDDYGSSLGDPPAGQDWNGAQTTIQRFGTDPLLNNQGEDRTLRTVFTHDHFGPSTHQQVGLYGAMLVEPSGTDWFDAVTGEQFPSRDDGGPTSWQALIEGRDSVESFREFAIAMGDLQLAYTAESRSKRAVPAGIWFTTKATDYAKKLNDGKIPAGLSDEFNQQGAPLQADANVTKNGDHINQWILRPNDKDRFLLAQTKAGTIDVKTLTISPSWADFDKSIWPPTHAQITNNGTLAENAPFPTIISDPGGNGNIGIWVNNYRNEPLDSRLQPEDGSSVASDPSYALSSIQRSIPALNKQPSPGAPIGSDSDGFKYPKNPLLPEGKDGVGGTDPYTPMLRAYAGDNVEVRAIVGALDSLHSFGIQGVNWNAEPSYADSGFRDVQGMGISEHFEMLFKLPPSSAKAQEPVDRMYAPSTSSMGLNKGAWGILRTYGEQVDGLASLENNPGGSSVAAGFYDLPAGEEPDKVFNISVSFDATKKVLQYAVDTIVVNPLVLRAAAGDWIQVNLTNKVPPKLAMGLKTNWTSALPNPNCPSSDMSCNASSNAVNGFRGSTQVGLNPRLIAYDAKTSSGLNVGQNGVSYSDYQTIAHGESKTYLWYAGNISVDDNNQRVLTPVEFGGVNLTAADLLLQSSYGLFGALVVEPRGSSWSKEDNHKMTAVINDQAGKPLFTELVVLGQSASSAKVRAGSEVRFRVLNPNVTGAGTVGDTTNLIAIEGHNWPEEPYAEGSAVIQYNAITQTMGSQQVTSLESYNMVLTSAGGIAKTPGKYAYYYYPSITPYISKGLKAEPLGLLSVSEQ